MTQEMLELLIGRHLDGEITPSEQRVLDAELDRDPRARELLAGLQDMHERCGEAVASEILDWGGAAEEIFERAWQRQSAGPVRSLMKMQGHVRFAAGLAAGLAMGLALHFVLPIFSTPAGDAPVSDVVAQAPLDQVDVGQPAYPEATADGAGDLIRKVDWYNFTDKHGNKWLVEGLREEKVKPAAYYEGL